MSGRRVALGRALGIAAAVILAADLQVVNPASGASRTAVTGAVRANVVF
jgi:hypothetical protein